MFISALYHFIFSEIYNSMMQFMHSFFFKQTPAYEMRISDWSSAVCSSDLPVGKRSETTGRSIPSDAIRPKCSKIHRLRKPFWHVPQSDPQVTCEAACRSRLFSACYS